MDSKNKNILIGGLLAIVLIMAVGYAAFATQLNINGTATIDASWNVHFDNSAAKTVTNATEDVTGVIAFTKGNTQSAPKGSISFSDNLNATVNATLQSPGDKVDFTLTIMNEGSFDATAGIPSIAWANEETGQIVAPTKSEVGTATNGNIKFTVSYPTPDPLVKSNGTATMHVTAEYLAPSQANTTTQNVTGNVASGESAGITVTLVYNQA